MAKKSGGGAADTIVKMVLSVFIALLAFSVGTFVGKQISESEHQKQALMKEYGSPGHSSPHEAGTRGGLSEEELAQLTAEFVETERRERAGAQPSASAPTQGQRETASVPPTQTAAAEADGYRKIGEPTAQRNQATPPPQKEAPQPAASTPPAQPSPAAQRVAAGQSPEPPPVTTQAQRQPDSVLPGVASSAIGKYTVQVASYPSEEEAKKHAAELQGAGWSSFYVPAEVSGRTWYRVSVGLFNNHRSANNFRIELMKEANISAAIVQQITQ